MERGAVTTPPCARVVLSAKPGHHAFDDRAIALDVPAKVGRAHKNDQVRRRHFDNHPFQK